MEYFPIPECESLAQDNNDNVLQQNDLLSRANTFRQDILAFTGIPEVLNGYRNFSNTCSPQSVQ